MADPKKEKPKSAESKLAYMREYNKKRRSLNLPKDKEYIGKTREKRNIYLKEYYAKNKESATIYKKDKYLKNRDAEIQKRKEWYNNNKDKHKIARNKYAAENKDSLREARRKWENNRLKTDVNYNLQKSLRNRIRLSLKGFYKKDKGTEELIGCTIEFFKKYIESQFLEGMTWGNWKFDGWHIDHKIPISWFNLENENCKKLAFSYKNMQPLWAADNFLKNSKRHDKISL